MHDKCTLLLLTIQTYVVFILKETKQVSTVVPVTAILIGLCVCVCVCVHVCVCAKVAI